jgi:hypothetical protein
LIARITEQNNTDVDANNNGFNKRYVIYLNELQKLILIHNKEMAKLKKLKLVIENSRDIGVVNK